MKQTLQRRIGLTGGIATGKTTISNYLAQKYHVPILDADVYARQAVEADSPILSVIFNRYGNQVKTETRDLNRAVLGEIIFQNPVEKQWLENQIHPYVRQQFEQAIKHLTETTIVLVIPLLFEAKMTDLVTEIWVVACSEETQIQRLMQRNQLTLAQAIARINNQLPLKDKIAQADVVLNNQSNLDELWQQIDQAFNREKLIK